MINLIKSEIYRLFISKCTYVILILMAFFSVLNVFIYKEIEVPSGSVVSSDESQASNGSFQVMDEEGEVIVDGNFGFQAFSDNKWYDSEYSITAVDFVKENIAGGFVLLFFTIFAVIFINGEIKSGYIKGILSYVGKRRRLVFANMTAAAVMLIMMFIVSFAASSIASMIFLKGIKLGFTGDFLIYQIVELLLHMAYIALLMFITYLVRSTAFSMTIGICIAAGFGTVVTNLLTILAQKLFNVGADFSITKYTITQNIMTLQSEFLGSDLTSPIIVGAVWAVVCIGFACAVLEKKDIR